MNVIFDIDGTLVDTSGFEDRLYLQAVQSILGDVSIRSSWAQYTHVSDAGILAGICRDNAIAPGDVEAKVRARFGEMVAAELKMANACSALPGGVAAFNALRLSGVHVGIATGGWGHTARMKLDAAGYAIADIALASSEDHHARVRIMQHCHAVMASSGTTVYVGDGEWDMQATAELNWRFLGVGRKLAGKCEEWIPDFSGGAFLEMLGR
jgi:phosphoglycolate phosphatase-like HAD superfamily hydrolase